MAGPVAKVWPCVCGAQCLRRLAYTTPQAPSILGPAQSQVTTELHSQRGRIENSFLISTMFQNNLGLCAKMGMTDVGERQGHCCAGKQLIGDSVAEARSHVATGPMDPQVITKAYNFIYHCCMESNSST